MRFRKLRITWSALCGIACVLLIALWVRSYWRVDLVLVRLIAANDLRFVSCRGQVATCISSPSSGRGNGAFRISPNAYMHSRAPWWISTRNNTSLGDSLQGNFRPNPYREDLGEPDGRIVACPTWWLVLAASALA